MKPWDGNGKRPRGLTGEHRVRVLWRNGEESRWTYKPNQLVWEHRGWDHDITGYEIVKES